MEGGIHDILKKYWNHDTFRDPQKEIIEAILKHNDVLTLLPTGSGKSLCFQIPTLLIKGVCIVISPLIALMEDQVKSLDKKGIKAIALTSKYSIEDSIIAFDNLKFGKYKFLYLSPEKLQSDLILSKLKELEVNLIAVDEAHCISEWGHDFRPAYLKISILREIFPDVNIVALTASATPKVSQDIIKYLLLKNVKKFKRSFSRENLVYKILKTENTRQKLVQILSKIKEPAIVYASSRKNCIDISIYLNKIGFKSSYYHGGLQNKQKIEAYENWISEKTPIMVATNAFGMGIDKSNVRAVIHINVPYSLENYLQEIGRAGRDNKKSYAFLIYNDSIVLSHNEYIQKGIANANEHRKVYTYLNQHYQVANGELPDKYYEFNLNEFCLNFDLSILKTQHILYLFNLENIIELQQNAFKRSSLKVIVSNSYLLKYESNNLILNDLLKVILRNYGGVFDQFIQINESFIAKKLRQSKAKVIEWLEHLVADKIIVYNKAVKNVHLKFLVPREDNFVINRLSQNINQKNKIKLDKAAAIINYIKNDKICRNIQLQNYFEESELKKCMLCDVCTESNTEPINRDLSIIGDEILSLLKINPQLSFEEIQNHLNYGKEYLIKTLQLMIEHETIKVTSLNKFEKLNHE